MFQDTIIVENFINIVYCFKNPILNKKCALLHRNPNLPGVIFCSFFDEFEQMESRNIAKLFLYSNINKGT